MNKVIITFILIFMSANSLASLQWVTECKEHKNSLTIAEVGKEHVGHTAKINLDVNVKEIKDGLWFVIDVKCSKDGFVIKAKHAPYNDKKIREFDIFINADGSYKII